MSGACARCRCPVITARVWEKAAASDRAEWTRAGRRKLQGRDLCTACYRKLYRAGDVAHRPIGGNNVMSSMRKRTAPPMPSAAHLAKNIRRAGATLDGLAFKYDVSPSCIRRRLNDAGYSSITGEPTVIPIRHRSSPLHLSAGGSAHHVGGGDYDRGLPSVVYKPPKPKPTGLDWSKLRPADQPLTPSRPDVELTESGHTFAPDLDWADPESLRLAGRSQLVPAGSGASAATDDTRDAAKHGRRLTERQRAEIVHRYKLGESAGALGRAFGVSDKTIVYTLKRAGCPLRNRSEAMRLVHS